MSAGIYVDSKYQANNGIIYKVRVQPETLDLTINALQNSPPAGAIDDGFPELKLTSTRKEFALVPRKVAIRITGASVDPERADYEGVGAKLIIPVLTPVTFAGWSVGTVGTYLGFPIEVIKKYDESGAVNPV